MKEPAKSPAASTATPKAKPSFKIDVQAAVDKINEAGKEAKRRGVRLHEIIPVS